MGAFCSLRRYVNEIQSWGQGESQREEAICERWQMQMAKLDFLDDSPDEISLFGLRTKESDT